MKTAGAAGCGKCRHRGSALALQRLPMGAAQLDTSVPQSVLNSGSNQ